MERSQRLWGSPFVLMSGLYITVALFFAVLMGLSASPKVIGPGNLNWVRVHLITIGTITQLIFAWLPGILSRKLQLPERSSQEEWLQWGLLNGGFVIIVVGLVGIDAWTASIGAGLVFTAVYRLLAGIMGAWKTSGRPWREGLRFYLTAPVYLMVGITMAITLLFNLWAPGGRMGMLEAHVHANVWGFLSMIVAGMLFDFFPALVGGPMARPHWIGRTYCLLNLGAIGLVVGPWVNLHLITIAGLVIYVGGTVLIILNLILTLVAAHKAPPAALHMLLAYTWMVVPAFFAPFIVLTPDRVNGPAIEAAATQGLINGWVLGIAMGAVPRMLRAWRTPDLPLFGTDGGHDDGCWPSVVALNLGVALVWGTALAVSPGVYMALKMGGYGLIAVAWVPFLRRVWRHMVGIVPMPS